MEEDDVFELDYKDGNIKIQRHSLSGQVIYRIFFSDKRPPLVVHRALNDNAARFWTSIPEGRQLEAEEIGPLIGEYLKKKQ
jgi:hypothetical protein